MSAPGSRSPNLEAILEQSVVGVYVVQDGRLVYVNPRLCELFGRTREALLALPSVLDLVAPSDRDLVRERLRQRIAGEIDSVQYVIHGLRADGSVVALEVHSVRTEHEGRPAVTGTMIDVATRRAESLGADARYRELIENASDIVYTHDLDGRLTSINSAAERLTGHRRDQLIGRLVQDLVLPAHADVVAEQIRRHVRDRRDAKIDLPIATPGGGMVLLEASARLIVRDGLPVEVHGIARDVTARRREEELLRSLAIVDDLTGLYNRRGFLTLAERHLRLAIRKQQGVFLLFADLDGLKQINDTYGHLEGDRALRDTAEALRRTFRSADIIARLGGDEFTVFPLEAAGESAELLIRRLEDNLRASNDQQPRPYRITLSVGIARYEPESSWTIEDLLARADQALYARRRDRRAAGEDPGGP